MAVCPYPWMTLPFPAGPLLCCFAARYFEQYNVRNRGHEHFSGSGKGGKGRPPPSSSKLKDEDVVDAQRLRGYDFSHLRGVKLIASAPGPTAMGVHSGPGVWNWGHLGLRRALADLLGRPPPQVPGAAAAPGRSGSAGGGSGGESKPSRWNPDPPAPGLRLALQFTSLGSVAEKTLCGQLADSFLGRFAARGAADLARYGKALKPPSASPASSGGGAKGGGPRGGGWRPPLPLELVVPTAEQVRRSTEGYAGGASIPLPTKNVAKEAYRQGGRNACQLAQYGGGAGALGRSRTLPHIKTYCLYELESPADPGDRGASSSSSSSSAAAARAGGGVKVHYCVLTSANLSNTAWGTLQLCDSGSPELKLQNYELGLLFFESCEAGRGAGSVAGTSVPSSRPLVPVGSIDEARLGAAAPPPHGAMAEARLLPLPYALPPRPFSFYDEPWTVDGAHREPDGLGRQWPFRVEKYGHGATSRQGFA
mmetsp:Transcript_59470/g.134628  ORF Transcript_59470/g.134628 Transcript_59470/m.134628 type:complete len:479 (+) Transcript_59470:377-1813(+)